MIYVILIVVLLAVVVGPSLWVQRVLTRYGEPADRYQGTGGELARHLLDNLGLMDVKTEISDSGDHYDPTDKAVRLTADKFNGRSLTAITVAAHEVGHAHQDASGFRPLKWRTRLVKLAAPGERVGAGLLMLVPLIALVTRAPALAGLSLLGGFLIMGLAALIHLVTLPTEVDASFGRALPMLQQGGYLRDGDERHARKILKAAALTYVATSLMSLVNIARWWAIFRR